MAPVWMTTQLKIRKRKNNTEAPVGRHKFHFLFFHIFSEDKLRRNKYGKQKKKYAARAFNVFAIRFSADA